MEIKEQGKNSKVMRNNKRNNFNCINNIISC